MLGLSIRGLAGNPTPETFNTTQWKTNGPFELSPERGRYALTYALTEYHSVSFPTALAKFAAPDVGYINGSYVSLFAPTVSLIAIPGYIIGKYFGAAQVGAFAVSAFFALLNVYLIRLIAIRLGAHPLAGTIGAVTFLFASPAFTYAVTLYQHHISTFLILSSLYLLIRFSSFWSFALIWLLFAFSLTVDYPNLFLMLPIAVGAFFKVFIVTRLGEVRKVSISLTRVFAMIGMGVPLLFFLWFNQLSYGSPFQLSGAVDRVTSVKADGSPLLERDVLIAQMKKEHVQFVDEGKSSFLGFFLPRNMIEGFATHLINPDRGMLYFTPVLFLGAFGAVILLRRKNQYVALLLGIIGFDLLLYSMWGDPYGGWAFGSRYLIPAYSILAIFISVLLTRVHKSNLVLLLFFVLFSYSVGVNTLGAITSSANPPKIEAQGLAAKSGIPQEYTYIRNVYLLNAGQVKSFAYESKLHDFLSPWQYYISLTFLLIFVTGLLLAYYRMLSNESMQEEIYVRKAEHPVLGVKHYGRRVQVPQGGKV